MDSKLKELFPLNSSESVIKFFKNQLAKNENEIDLTLISICLGYFENFFCKENTNSFPVLEFAELDELYKKFKTIVSIAENVVPQSKSKKSIAENPEAHKVASREKIKKISDVIWHSLLRSSYKDRCHLQSVYSYLKGNKLDSFGFALVTVAACQILDYKNIHLCLGEDHVWVAFGEKTAEESMEITWHGKVAEDKRGQSVGPGIEARSWLYLAGNPVVCTRYTELAVICLSINPHLSPTHICAELADLQQQLLWILHDNGHLKNYPMGLMYLGEMEENHKTTGRKTCEELYEEAIESSMIHYKNHHVYPFTCKGNYYYRRENFRNAFQCWAKASDVIRLYNYSRDDEEIYKEFLDIANEQIPQIMKTESSGHSAKSIIRDPHCFANLIRFYDGICQWEEGSQTPILHIGWAKQLCFSISKFDYDIRSQIQIISKSDNCDDDDDDDDNNNKSVEIVVVPTEAVDVKKKEDSVHKSPLSSNGDLKSEFSTLPSLDELTAACREKILNPDFLLHGDGVPFSEPQADEKESENPCVTKSPLTDEKVLSPASSSNLASPSTSHEDEKIDTAKPMEVEDHDNDKNNNSGKTDEFDSNVPKAPVVVLKSRKMKGLKDLLLSEKLNTNAVSLQITAQSHIGYKKSRSNLGGEDSAENSRPKRNRRE